ncbi:MAG: protein kinase domain-containing protein [Candidatus Brocadiia bacterium]
MPVLLLKLHSGKTREFPVGDRVQLGRGSDCDVRIHDDRASRRHAEIWHEADGYFIRDLGSRNGTRVNRRLVERARLAFGDEIRLGRTRLIFSEHAPSQLIGASVGGYRVLEELGSGGMGIVYLAAQDAVDRVVALKVLHPRLADDRKFVERFLREARAAAALNHVNIVHVYEAGRTDQTYFYAMEYIEGPTVAEELHRGRPIHVDRAIKIAMDIAAALGYAHKQGVVHRDVKPENIMLAPDGTAKLADLGLAKAIESKPRDVPSPPGSRARVWGTPAYIAPEVAIGHDADPRSDLYSLGAALFHMLTGRVPFVGATPTEMLTDHVHAPLPDLQTLAPQVPRMVSPVVEKLMAKNPERRYQSAEELIADLSVLRESVRQVAAAEETRYATPLFPQEPAPPSARGTLLERLRKWLGRPPE